VELAVFVRDRSNDSDGARLLTRLEHRHRRLLDLPYRVSGIEFDDDRVTSREQVLARRAQRQIGFFVKPNADEIALDGSGHSLERTTLATTHEFPLMTSP
jgi:hypothetical protein